jgi:serine O-acetyltransferase
MMKEKPTMTTLSDNSTGNPIYGPATSSPGLWKMMREDITCVFQRDPAARSTLELLTIYPGVHALVLHRLAHTLWRYKICYGARLLSFIARMLTQIDIHPGATIGRRFFIDHGCGVVIGETSEIGDDVTLYHGVTLGGTSWNSGKRHPTLGNGVVVGAGAKILGPVNIGSNARIAANSVVIEDISAEMTVVGIPGRMVVPKHQRRITADGIDLDHHRMPDPVGKAISCLLDRITELELQIAKLAGKDGAAGVCQSCDGDDCAQPSFDASPKPDTAKLFEHS